MTGFQPSSWQVLSRNSKNYDWEVVVPRVKPTNRGWGPSKIDKDDPDSGLIPIPAWSRLFNAMVYIFVCLMEILSWTHKVYAFYCQLALYLLFMTDDLAQFWRILWVLNQIFLGLWWHPKALSVYTYLPRLCHQYTVTYHSQWIGYLMLHSQNAVGKQLSHAKIKKHLFSKITSHPMYTLNRLAMASLQLTRECSKPLKENAVWCKYEKKCLAYILLVLMLLMDTWLHNGSYKLWIVIHNPLYVICHTVQEMVRLERRVRCKI